MPALLVHVDGAQARVPLAASALVGRHWSCAVRLRTPRAPLYWLEIRYTREGWRWRELRVEPDARGAEVWNALRRRPVRLDAEAWIALEGDGPPELALVDVVSGEVRAGDALDELIEHTDAGVRPLGDDDGPYVNDGDVRVIDGRAWRFFLGELPEPTARDGFAVDHPTTGLDLDVGACVAVLHNGRRTARAAGDCVRALAVYALARREAPDDGWLNRDAAFARWVALGGKADSPPKRVAWDRGKLRTQLARAGVVNLNALFDHRTRDGRAESRIGLSAARMTILS